MAVKADSDGFLVGQPVELDTRWMERVLSMVGSLSKDMAEVRRILAGQRGATRTGQRSAAVTQAKPSSARPVRAGQSLPDRAQSISAAVSPQRQARAIASAVATMAARDAKGRFIGKASKATLTTQSSFSNVRDDVREPKEPKEPRGGDRERGRFAKLAGEAAKDGALSAVEGTSQVDPVLGAVKEIGAPLAAVGKVIGGGLFDSWKDRAERKKEKRAAKESAKETVKAQIPWFKRIIESRGGGGGEAGGGGMLSGLLSMLGIGGGSAIGGGIGGLLARAAGGIKGIFSGGGSKIAGLAKGGLGKALLPIGAIMSAVKSFNVSSEDYAKRYGTEIGGSIGKDMLVRTAGVLQDLVNSLLLGIPQYLGEKIGSAAVTAREAVSNGWNMVTGKKPAPITNPAGTAKPASSGIRGGSGGGMGGMPGAGNLLDLIRSKEGGKAGYDAFWNGSRVKPKKPMSQMTLGEVRQWQRETLNEQASRGVSPKRRSSAAGGYQFMSGTLPRAMSAAGLGENDMFDQKNQDRLAMALLDMNKTSGISAWKSGKASDAKFADYVASQWASFKDSSGGAQYDVPGFNKATVGADKVISAARAMPPSGGRAGAAPASTPVVPAGAGASRTSAKPSPAQMALPPPPPEQARIGSNRRGKDPVQVTLPRELTQNLSDRGIAQLATGGMGGNMARGVG